MQLRRRRNNNEKGKVITKLTVIQVDIKIEFKQTKIHYKHNSSLFEISQSAGDFDTWV